MSRELADPTRPGEPAREQAAETPPASGMPAARAALADHAGQGLALLSLTALGVVYGDIGTSPLYALRECFAGVHPIVPTPANVFGVLSLIFWALILIVTVKYIVFVLRADNRGEGGILALTSLATPIRPLVLSRPRWLVLLGVSGAALLYGDGVITPAISVLSAVEGLEVATPVFTPYVVPITLAIIVGMFLIQSGGTARIGGLFGPIMLLWFGVLALLGLVHIVQHPAVLMSVNPVHAVRFFATNGWPGFLVLGTVVLAVTGSEALYADMGHFGPRPIRLAWFALVLPALLLNYFGQGSLLLRVPESAENVFYHLAPAWALYPLVVLAMAATIIASQALISGAFSLTMQAENLGFLPRMRILHTSAQAFGQIYIPLVNWGLMAVCITVVVGFRTSSNLAAAYGVAAISTMTITTIIFSVVAHRRWRWSVPVVAGVAGVFLLVESAFLGANLVKIPHGGWFPLVVGALIFAVMTTWKRGSWLVVTREQNLEMELERLLARLRSQPPKRMPGTAVFLSANPVAAPAALLANLQYNGVLHERVLLTTVQVEEIPRVHLDDRVRVEPLGEGLYRVTLCYGFMEEPNVPRALRRLTLPDGPFDTGRAPYFVSRTRVLPTRRPGMALWREHLYMVLRRNAASAADFFKLPPERVFEIGTTIEM